MGCTQADWLNHAMDQYNKIWHRAWDDAHETGGLFWKRRGSQGDWSTKNACVHGPAAIAGFLLAKYAPRKTGFHEQGRSAFIWLRDNLYVDGMVLDHLGTDGN